MSSISRASLALTWGLFLSAAIQVLADEPPLTPQQQALFNEGAELYQRALVLHGRREYEQAMPLAKRVLEIGLTIQGENSVYTSNARNLLGTVARSLRDFEIAKLQFEKVLEVRRKIHGERDLQTAAAWKNLGNLLADMDELDESVRCLDKWVDIVKANHGERSLEALTAAMNVAFILRLNGDYDAALARQVEVLRQRETSPNLHPELIAETLLEIGRTYSDMKNFQKAKEFQERALALSRNVNGEQHQLTATILDDLGNSLREVGEYPQARRYLEQGLAIRTKLFGTQHTDTAASHTNLGSLLTRIGDNRAARSHLEQALAIHQAIQTFEDANIGAVYINLGLLLIYSDDRPLARTYLEKAVSIYTKLFGEQHPATAQAHLNLAILLTELGELAEARSHVEKSLAVYRAVYGNQHLATAEAINNLACVVEKLGDMPESLHLFRQALDITQQILGANHIATSQRLFNVAQSLESNHKTDEAIEHLERERRISHEFSTQLLPHLSDREQLEFLSNSINFQGSLQIAWMHPENNELTNHAAEWLLNGKALSQEALAGRALASRNTNNSAVAKTAQELSRVRQQLASLAFSTPSADDAPSYHQKLQELQATERELARTVVSTDTKTQQQGDWVKLNAVRQKIPKDSVLVEIARFEVFNLHGVGNERVWQPARYAAWIIPPLESGDVSIIDLGEAEAIDKLIAQARRSIESPEMINSQGDEEAEKTLHEPISALARSVFEPIVQKLPVTSNRILLSPDANLWLIPWSALPLPDGRYAVEQYEIQFLVSGRELNRNANDQLQTTAPVIMADPSFDLGPRDSLTATRAVMRERFRPSNQQTTRSSVSSLLPKVGRLPGSADEARTITPNLASFTGATPNVYLEQYAQEGILKAIVRPRVVVLSTHGFFLKDSETATETPQELVATQSRSASPAMVGKLLENPLVRCGLLLAGCNQRETIEGGEDGILTGLEIVAMDLHGTELVVLSACETGVGDIQNGEGVAGLRQAFQLAGADTVISTLWSVPDRESAILMNTFFERLAAGDSKPVALRAAQLERIKSRRDRYGAAHPFFWAAWTVTGKHNIN